MNRQHAKSLPRDWARFATVFSALGDPYRQRILLSFEAGERLTIKEIVDVLPLSRTAVAHHLRVLRAAKLLASSKEGRDVYLTVNKTLLTETLESTLHYARTSL